MFVFIKDLAKCATIRSRGLKFSRYTIPGLLEILAEIPAKNYILGVTYKEGDSQIFISGKAKKGESLFDAAQRELGEELALKMKFEDENKTTYVVDIGDCMDCKNPMMAETDEESKRRVFVCVHGDRERILKYINKVSLGVNEDAITHIWSAKAGEVLQNLLWKREQLKWRNT